MKTITCALAFSILIITPAATAIAGFGSDSKCGRCPPGTSCIDISTNPKNPRYYCAKN